MTARSSTQSPQTSPLDLFVGTVETLSRICGILAATCLLVACLVVCQMVFMRYVLNASTIWQTEFVTYAVTAATLIGSPYVLLLKGHVNVDLLPLYLGQRSRLVLALVTSVMACVFCALLTWTGWDYFHEAWTQGWRTETVWAPPLWIPLLPLPLGMGLLTLQYLADILCLLSGRSLPFGLRPEDRP